MEFDSKKFWYIPKPVGARAWRPQFEKVSQVKFYNEYYPTGHKIFDRGWFKDLLVVDPETGRKEIYEVNRVSVPIQKMAIDIILAHLFGNKTQIVDGTLQDNKALPKYKEYWLSKNIDTEIYEFGRSALSLGDSAVLFYRDGGKLNCQTLSFFNGEEFNMEYDKYGKPYKFYKFYDNKCDVYDAVNCITYALDAEWKEISRAPHGFNGLPVVYHKRNDGAYWSCSQSNIDNMEQMLSRLSEDNRKKFKSLYHLSTHDPDSVVMESAGATDMVITDSDGDFKMVSGADISPQFKFEFETQLELIFNALGIVFPKHKSSGDMPTGSMKMMFYPTERTVMSLIHEFNASIDAINNIVKQGFVVEYPEYLDDITNGNIRASIRMFTPQDDETKVRSITELKRYNVISGETASDEAPYAANNEELRKQKEREAEIEYERRMENLRNVNPRTYGD